MRRAALLLSVLVFAGSIQESAQAQGDVPLGLVMTDAKDTVDPGEQITYEIRVSNFSDAPLHSASLMFRALNGLLITGFESTTYTDEHGYFPVEYLNLRAQEIAPGGYAVVTVRGVASRPGTVYLQATASGWVRERFAGELRGVESTRVRGELPPGGTGTDPDDQDPPVYDPVDLAVTVKDLTDPVGEGETYSYVVTVTNGGKNPARFFTATAKTEGATITDRDWLPLRLKAGRDLAPGASVSWPLEMRAGPAGTAKIEVSLSRYTVLDMDSTNDIGVEETQIRPGSIPSPPGIETFIDRSSNPTDFAVTVSDSKDPVDDGEVFTFKVRVVDNMASTDGQQRPRLGTLEIHPPPGIEILGLGQPGYWSHCDQGPPVTCSLSPDAGGYEFEVFARGRLPEGGTVGTRFVMTSSGRETDPSDNERTEMTTIRPRLSVPGGGTGTAPGGGTGTIPGGGSAPPTGQAGPPTGGTPPSSTPPADPPTGTVPGGTGTTIPPAPPSTLPSPPVTPGGKLIGVVPFNREGNLFLPPLRAFEEPPDSPFTIPDLWLTGTVPSQVTADSPFDLALEILNRGDAPATQVVLRFQLSDDGRIQFVSPLPSFCSQLGSGVECDLGTIPSLGARAFSHRVRAIELGQSLIRAEVSSREEDRNASDNAVQLNVNVIPGGTPPQNADLAITGAATTSPFVPGQTGGFRFQLRNDGPAPAPNTRVFFNYDYFDQVSGGSTPCTPDGEKRVQCTIGDLGSGEQRTIEITGPVSSGATGNATGTASVSSTSPDPNPANNEATVTVPIQAPPAASADLSLSTTAPGAVEAGQTFRYQHTVVNNGPDTANGVVVENTMDANAIFVSCSPTCTPPSGGGRVVRCTVPALARMASGSVFVDVRAPQAAGTLLNEARVTGTESDPNPSNNTTTKSTAVSAPAPACALGIAPGTYRGDGGCGASGNGPVTCAGPAEVRIGHPSLNLVCDSAGNCGDANVVFGQPNHRCTLQNVGGILRVHCDQLTNGMPNGAACDQRFTRQ